MTRVGAKPSRLHHACHAAEPGRIRVQLQRKMKSGRCRFSGLAVCGTGILCHHRSGAQYKNLITEMAAVYPESVSHSERVPNRRPNVFLLHAQSEERLLIGLFAGMLTRAMLSA
jgi:hypothetical protein